MGLTFNGKTPSTIQIGGKQVDNIVMNGEVVWPAQPTEPNYFYIENNSTNSICYVKLQKNYSGTYSSGTTLAYSYDKENWTTCTYDSNNAFTFQLSPSKRKIYFRSSNNFSAQTRRYTFTNNGTAGGTLAVGGDIRTLLNYTSQNLYTAPAYCFDYLFSGFTRLTDASQLDLSGLTKMNNYSFEGLFYNCSGLTSAPNLPATSLANYCYQSAFENCTNLVNGPTIYATSMEFTDCFKYMFRGSSKLSSVKTYITSWNSANSTEWLRNVASSGTFYNLGKATNIPSSDSSGRPSGWSIRTSL